MKFFEKRSRKAAISIFLTIITIPCMLLSAILIDGSRFASAKAMTQEAADLAATSVLANYNQDLKDEFGLFAMNDTDADTLKKKYMESLEATLLAYGLDPDEYSSLIWQFMKSTVTGGTSYAGASFLNLYDFQVDSEATSVKPLFSLAEKEVLKSQMVEYSKFRGIFVALDRLDFLKQLSDQSASNKENAKAMEAKMDVDQANAAADQAVTNVTTAITTLMNAISAYNTALTDYEKALDAKMQVIRHQNIYPEESALPSSVTTLANGYDSKKSNLYAKAKAVKDAASALRTQASTAKTEAESAVGRLDSYCTTNGGGGDAAQEAIKDAQDGKADYQNYVTQLQSILDDACLKYYAEQVDPSGITTTANKIDAAIKKDAERVAAEKQAFEAAQSAAESGSDSGDGGSSDDEEEEKEEYTNDHYDFYNLELTSSNSDRSYMCNSVYMPAIRAYMAGNGTYSLSSLQNASWKGIKTNYSDGSKSTSAGESKKDELKSQDAADPNKDTNTSVARKEIPQDVYNARPSKTYAAGSSASIPSGVYDDSKNANVSKAKSIMSSGQQDTMADKVVGMLEGMRDDLLELSYLFGTFKTRMTGDPRFTAKAAEGNPAEYNNNNYMPKWRYEHEEGEWDMRFEAKKDRKTVLRSELEYIFAGQRTDALNEAAVYAAIYVERLANNMIVLYLNSGVKASCHAAAAAASALTAGFVPEPVFFWIFLAVWAGVETKMDMDLLIDYGYKIPLIKTKDHLLTDLNFSGGFGTTLAAQYGPVDQNIFISYEDYLLIMLLLVGDDTRVMRAADLIEMNMKENGASDFTMAKAYTYLQADTGMSVRYLFNNVMPFQSSYEQGGYTGRLQFTNSIYLGY